MYVHPDRLAGQRATIKAWIGQGLHLPACLRDLHAAKRVFKSVGNSADMRGGDDPALGAVSWVSAQIYVIDRFLWWMALHGYTLQRSRARLGVPFLDLDESVAVREEAERESFAQAMAEARAERALIGDEAPSL